MNDKEKLLSYNADKSTVRREDLPTRWTMAYEQVIEEAETISKHFLEHLKGLIVDLGNVHIFLMAVRHNSDLALNLLRNSSMRELLKTHKDPFPLLLKCLGGYPAVLSGLLKESWVRSLILCWWHLLRALDTVGHIEKTTFLLLNDKRLRSLMDSAEDVIEVADAVPYASEYLMEDERIRGLVVEACFEEMEEFFRDWKDFKIDRREEFSTIFMFGHAFAAAMFHDGLGFNKTICENIIYTFNESIEWSGQAPYVVKAANNAFAQLRLFLQSEINNLEQVCHYPDAAAEESKADSGEMSGETLEFYQEMKSVLSLLNEYDTSSVLQREGFSGESSQGVKMRFFTEPDTSIDCALKEAALDSEAEARMSESQQAFDERFGLVLN